MSKNLNNSSKEWTPRTEPKKCLNNPEFEALIKKITPLLLHPTMSLTMESFRDRILAHGFEWDALAIRHSWLVNQVSISVRDLCILLENLTIFEYSRVMQLRTAVQKGGQK